MGYISHVGVDNSPRLSPMPFNARREAQIIGFAVVKRTSAQFKEKGQNWKKRSASDLTVPQRSLTASRGCGTFLHLRGYASGSRNPTTILELCAPGH